MRLARPDGIVARERDGERLRRSFKQSLLIGRKRMRDSATNAQGSKHPVADRQRQYCVRLIRAAPVQEL
jgi:hypothetical protein